MLSAADTKMSVKLTEPAKTYWVVLLLTNRQCLVIACMALLTNQEYLLEHGPSNKSRVFIGTWPFLQIKSI